jgi:hypothetical protein
MKKIVCVFALALFLNAPVWADAAPKLRAPEVSDLQLPDVTITTAEHLPKTVDKGQVTEAHLKVSGVIGGSIRFETLLPDDWNGRFAMGGGGGLVGSVQNGIRRSVNSGYATAGTDTGHQGRGSTDGSWALDNVEAFVNFGHVAIHRTAEVSKALIRAYYGTGPEKSYFVGCSRGGGQAMMEAQRYPEDFDGIVAGAPAFDWTGFAALGIYLSQVQYPDPNNLTETYLTQEVLDRIYDEIMAQGDELDGLKDGIIDDPREVSLDVDTLPDLTLGQRQALKALYGGARNSDGPIYPGFPVGAERGRGGLFEWQVGPIPDLVNLGYGFTTNIYKYFVFNDPDWDYSTYDFDGWAEDTHLAGTVLNATDPNLDAFKERGGKLILWHGWSDAALPAQATIDYYERVLARDPKAMDYARLFMIGGCYHCAGGPGASGVDWLTVVRDWVETGEAPDRIVARKAARNDQPAMSRPLVPYPQRVMYDGEGDSNEAESFVLRKP